MIIAVHAKIAYPPYQAPTHTLHYTNDVTTGRQTDRKRRDGYPERGFLLALRFIIEM